MKILLVEDDGGSRGILLEHLSARGWQVVCATDPVRGQRMLETEAPDLVLTDIHMPGAQGTEHVRRFCAGAGERAPAVVVMTGFPSLESCLDSFAAGAAGYLVKPFRVAEFVQLAEKVLAQRGLQERNRDLEARLVALEAELARLRAAGPARGAPPLGAECR
jgi:DNA-binding response OmpR family regulator